MSRNPVTCRRCGEHPASGFHDLCETCSPYVTDAVFETTRSEREEGLLTLERYLEAHAAFDDWCDRHPRDAEVARTVLNELRQLRQRRLAA